ncbi:hypothetical protein PMAC_001141 [Pneumocystis sp. 'macacae']|nr:hypothetical protein PMAC_001141 [Pneumocystis sp. 'macacae']
MNFKISEFIETLVYYFSIFNEDLKNKGLKEIRKFKKFKFDLNDLEFFLSDLDVIDRFSEKIVLDFTQFIDDLECFLIKVYKNKVTLDLDFVFLETVIIIACKIGSYCLKLKSLRILLIWLRNNSGLGNYAHPNFIVNLLNISFNVLENVCLRRVALFIINYLVKGNVENKKTIIDKNEFFDLKEIGKSIMVSDDFKVQELCVELIYELLPPKDSPTECYNRIFDLFFPLNTLSQDLRNEFLDMQNLGWTYPPKWLISLNIERNCESAPLTFKCLYLKLGGNVFSPVFNDGVLFVHVSKEFLSSVVYNSENKMNLLDIALKDVEEIIESDNQIMLRLKENIDGQSSIGDDLGFFNSVMFCFDSNSETKIIIQKISQRIKKNMDLGINIKCSIIECPISLKFKDGNNSNFNNSFSQHRTILVNMDKSHGFVVENLIRKNELEGSKFLDIFLEENIKKDEKLSSVDRNEIKEVESQFNDFRYPSDNNCLSYINSSSENCKKDEEKSLLRVPAQVQDLFSLVILENDDASKNIKLSEKMKKKHESLEELTNNFSLDEALTLNENNDFIIKQKNNDKNFNNENIYGFSSDNISYFNKSRASRLRSKKKYVLKSSLPTYTLQKKNKNKLQSKKHYSNKDFIKNGYSSATDYDTLPNDLLSNSDIVNSIKKDKVKIRKRSFSNKNSSRKEILNKVESLQSKKCSLKLYKKVHKNINCDSDILLSSDNINIKPRLKKKEIVLSTDKAYSLQLGENLDDNYEQSFVKNLYFEKQNKSILNDELSQKNNNEMSVDINIEEKIDVDPIDECYACKPQVVTWSKDNSLNNTYISENNALSISETVLKLSMTNETIKDDKKYLYSDDSIVVENIMKIEKDSEKDIYNDFEKDTCGKFNNISIFTNDELMEHSNANSSINPLNIYKKNDNFSKDVNFNNFPNNFYNILNAYGLLPTIKIDNVNGISSVDLDKTLFNSNSTERFSEFSCLDDYDSQLNLSDIECNGDIYSKYFYKLKWRKGLPEYHRKTLNLLVDIIQIIINKLVACELNINDHMLNFKDNINKIIEVLNMVRRDKRFNIEKHFFFRDNYNKQFVNHLNRIEKHKNASEKIKLSMKKVYLAQKKIIDDFCHNISNIC